MSLGPLLPLRSHLAALSRRRWAMRASGGLLAVLLTFGWLLFLVFLADWTFRFSRGERVALLFGLAATLVWAYARWMHRPLRHRETEVDLALRIDRKLEFGGDVVAALQFDAAGIGSCGSAVLEQAVVRRVSALRELPRPTDDQAAGRLRRLAVVGLASLAVLSVIAGFFPTEAKTFADRLLLGTAHYPTRTVITRLQVNGIDMLDESDRDRPLRSPFGRPLRFEVECTGDIPAEGRIRMTSSGGGQQGELTLKPTAAKRLFTADVGRLLEPISFRVRLGDAETDPATIESIHFPAVDLELTTTPPEYAARKKARSISRGVRQISVLEGSRVELQITSRNKPLRSAVVRIAGRDYALAVETESRRAWVLTETTPFERVGEPLQFELRVVDDDGLSTDEPLRGSIGIEPDHPPRAALGVMTDTVLPAAEPVVSWGVSDDYGVAEVRLRWRILRAGGEVDQDSLVLRPTIAMGSVENSVRGRHVLLLAPMRLAPGDEVRLALEAVDDRGDHTGVPAASEAVVLRVTDETGVLAALAEADEKSARELDEIIERELRIGAAP